jgi:hypothetical protein
MASVTKSRQAQKIGEIADALVGSGYRTLDQQAKVLGLCRSTAWTIIKPPHKASGLTAGVINRMLSSPRLPEPARHKINEYVRERLAGTYGHGKMQLRRFARALSDKALPTATEMIKTLRGDSNSALWPASQSASGKTRMER